VLRFCFFNNYVDGGGGGDSRKLEKLVVHGGGGARQVQERLTHGLLDWNQSRFDGGRANGIASAAAAVVEQASWRRR
jgi:hypothetical protein